MFTTFNAILPTYEILTPQTKQTFLVRSLTVADEEKLKASLMNESKILSHLNKCIFDAIAEKPEKYTFKEFLETTTMRDRDALLFGLYHITYDEIRNYSVSCSKCGNNQDVTINASDTFSINPYDGKEKEILEKRIPVPLKLLKGVTIFIKQPTLHDENELMRKYSFSGTPPESVMDTLIIEKIEHTPEEATSPTVYTDARDIQDAYVTIPSRDKKVLNDAYKENFGKFNIELKMNVVCPSCGNKEVNNIDLVDNFFRAMYQ